MTHLIVHIGPPPKKGKKYLVRCREIATYDLGPYVLELLSGLAEKGHFGGYENLTVNLVQRVTRGGIVMNDVILEIGGGDRRADIDILVAAWRDMGITVTLRTLTLEQYKDLWRAYLSATPYLTRKRSQ